MISISIITLFLISKSTNQKIDKQISLNTQLLGLILFHIGILLTNNLFSINHTYVNETHKEPACSETGDKDILEKAAESIQKIKVNETILYTYDVVFIPSNHTLATRWDHYVNMHSDKIHWFSLINSFLVVAIFSALVVHIFCRALKRDIDYINSVKFLFLI